MPTFTTPTAIDLAITLPVGDVTVIASDRTDTVVTVAATNPARAVDRRGAEQTRVEFDGDRLEVVVPRPRFSVIGPSESVDITVELPTGSRFTGDVSVGAVRTSGRLGATRIKALTGSAHIDSTGDLWLRAGHGSATVGTIDGSAEITADHGRIRIGTVTGDATLKASHGSVTVAESGGDLEAKLSYGDVEIGRAHASVAVKTAYGSIQVSDVSAGSIEVDSGFGEITVGVHEGVPAWLDLSSKEGRVRNELDADSPSEGAEGTVAIRARTQFGNITVNHASVS